MLDFYLQLNKEKNAHDTTKSRLVKNEKQFKQLNRGEESMTYFDEVWFFFQRISATGSWKNIVRVFCLYRTWI